MVLRPFGIAPMAGSDQLLQWHEVTRPDATICYLDSGGSAPPVVLVHGLAGHAGEWISTMCHLAGRWRALALDQRGHGRSTRRPHDLSRATFADDVVAVITAAGIDQPVVLVGQSMGAHTAFITAARYPHLVRHLVMIESDVGGGGNEDLVALRAALASWPAPFPDTARALTFFGGDTAPARAWVDGLEPREDGLWPRWNLEVMLETMRPIFDHEAWPEWAALSPPTLLVLGQSGLIDTDRIERMRAVRSATRVVTIAQAGHDVHLEQPHAWLRALDAFLA
jgi:pimeloyl-ACP methyl ester carboxylesterase